METKIEDTDPVFLEYALKKSLISRNKLAIILKGTNKKALYCCVECPARYDDKEKLELHLCMHNNEYRFLCGICGTGLKRKEHLERHTMEHNQVRPHVCPICGKGFKRKEHLNIHQTLHYGDKSQSCSLCNKTFHRKDHLQKHLQTHSKLFMEQNLYAVGDQMDIKEEALDEEVKQDFDSDADCDPEGLEFDNTDNPELNGDSQGSSDTSDVRTPQAADRPFVCEICYKSYKRKDHLKIHSWTHKKKDKVCTECGKGFHKQDQLFAHKRVCIQVHLQQLNREEEMVDILEDPNGVPPSNTLVAERPAATEADESRPHECVICHRRFKRKQHLKVHANVHLKQPNVWCYTCNKGFQLVEQFETHQCMPHGDMGYQEDDQKQQDIPLDAKKENNHPTQFMELEMVEGDIMESEMVEGDMLEGAMVEGEPPVLPSPPSPTDDERNLPVPQKVFVCKYCSKAFRRKDHYKIHLNIHTGVKSFFCMDCGKGFYRKDHLQKHSQVHAKPKQQVKGKKQLPDLLPISSVSKAEVKPEITIHAPSNAKLRVPLQMKVPYQYVMSSEDGSQHTLTVAPFNNTQVFI